MKRRVEHYGLEIPVAETLEEANALITSFFAAHAEAVGLLRRKLNENEALLVNLRATQDRCTELLLENREARRALVIATKASALPRCGGHGIATGGPACSLCPGTTAYVPFPLSCDRSLGHDGPHLCRTHDLEQQPSLRERAKAFVEARPDASGEEIAASLDRIADARRMNAREPCTKPPKGWRCTRGFHADGPCAAVEDE